jgi:hypothetical protein
VGRPVWIQQVVIGLAGERGVKPIEVLRAQAPFLDTLSFHTRWARQMFPQELIKAKIGEAEKLVRLLKTDPATKGAPILCSALQAEQVRRPTRSVSRRSE